MLNFPGPYNNRLISYQCNNPIIDEGTTFLPTTKNKPKIPDLFENIEGLKIANKAAILLLIKQEIDRKDFVLTLQLKNTISRFLEVAANIQKLSKSPQNIQLNNLNSSWEELQKKEFKINNIELRQFCQKLKSCFNAVKQLKPVELGLETRAIEAKRSQDLLLALDNLGSLNDKLNKLFENEFEYRNKCEETDGSNFNNFTPTLELIIKTRENPKLTNNYEGVLNEVFPLVEESYSKSRQIPYQISKLSMITMSMIALNETHAVQHLIDFADHLINNIDLNHMALDTANPEISPTKNRAFTMMAYLLSYNLLSNNEGADDKSGLQRLITKYKSSGVAALISLPLALATGTPQYLLHWSEALPIVELITPIAESKFKKISNYLAASGLTMYSLMFESFATAVVEGSNSFLIAAMKDKVLEIKDSTESGGKIFSTEGFYGVQTLITEKDRKDSPTYDHFHRMKEPVTVQLKDGPKVDIIAFNPTENLYLVKKHGDNENDFAYSLDLQSINTDFWDYTYQTHCIRDTKFSLIVNNHEHSYLQKNPLSKIELIKALGDGPLFEDNEFKLYKIRDLFCVETQNKAWVSLDMALRLFDLDAKLWMNNETDEENNNDQRPVKNFFQSAIDTTLEHFVAPMFQ